MMQPNRQARLEYLDTVDDRPVSVDIPGTKRSVRIRGIKPGTLKALTRLWAERDAHLPDDSSDTLKSMATDPYFNVKQACLFVLNSYWGIRLVYPFMWRWWGMWKGYTESQMTPIIAAGKKKLPLAAHWTNMALTVDMREDWMKMTTKEAERYRAELLSVASQLSLRTTRGTEGHDTSSSD